MEEPHHKASFEGRSMAVHIKLVLAASLILNTSFSLAACADIPNQRFPEAIFRENNRGGDQRDRNRARDNQASQNDQEEVGQRASVAIPYQTYYYGEEFPGSNGNTISSSLNSTDSLVAINQSFNSLDVYLPNSTSLNLAAPIMIFVHGGGWRQGDKSYVANKPDFFTRNGFVFISINYRLSYDRRGSHDLRAVHPDHIEDVARAIAWVHSNAHSFRGNPDVIFLMGHSAGAHLVSLVSTDESYLNVHGLGLNTIKGTISVDTEFYDLVRAHNQNSGGAWRIENAFGLDPEVWADASPINHISPEKNIPPFLITFSARFRQRQSEEFASALRLEGIPVGIIPQLNESHESINTNIGLSNYQFTQEIQDFTTQYLEPNIQ